MVPTWILRDGAWIGEAPSLEAFSEAARAASGPPGDRACFAFAKHLWTDVWFIKEANTNFGVGVSVCDWDDLHTQRALRALKPGKTYVAQPSVGNPRVDERGCKLGWRLYVACVSAPNSKALRWFYYNGGYVVAADGVLRRDRKDPLGHVTKDRIARFADWPERETFEPIMRDKITRMLREAQPKMKPPVEKACFELFGVDLIVEQEHDDPSVPVEDTVWIVEVNRSPRVKISDKPMLHALLNIAVPKYGLPQPSSATWDELDVDPFACDTWHPDEGFDQMEMETWGRGRWGRGGQTGEGPLPSAFGGDAHWGARAEEKPSGA
jgi:hypothetical protein